MTIFLWFRLQNEMGCWIPFCWWAFQKPLEIQRGAQERKVSVKERSFELDPTTDTIRFRHDLAIFSVCIQKSRLGRFFFLLSVTS